MSSPKRSFIPRKRQERGARRVEAIVAAAAALFAERGFDGTSMNAIAKASGLTIGSLYQYFPNRDAIVDAVAELYLTAWRAEKDEALALVPADTSLHDFISRGVRSLFDFHTTYAGVKAFLDADPRCSLRCSAGGIRISRTTRWRAWYSSRRRSSAARLRRFRRLRRWASARSSSTTSRSPPSSISGAASGRRVRRPAVPVSRLRNRIPMDVRVAGNARPARV
jgi:AcrR family transcriptional regulator